MRLKKCVLSLLRKLVRVEMSLMSDGSAFQARGRAMEKALLVTWSRVRETTKLPRTLVSSQRRTSFDKYCGAVPWLMSTIKVHSLNWILLDTGSLYCPWCPIGWPKKYSCMHDYANNTGRQSKTYLASCGLCHSWATCNNDISDCYFRLSISDFVSFIEMVLFKCSLLLIIVEMEWLNAECFIIIDFNTW